MTDTLKSLFTNTSSKKQLGSTINSQNNSQIKSQNTEDSDRTVFSLLKASPSVTKSPSITSETATKSPTVKTLTEKLPTVKTTMQSIDSETKKTTANINSTVKNLESTTRESVNEIEKTLSPLVTPIVEPITQTAEQISTSVEQTFNKTVKTINNSPITKRFLGLFILPFQENGVNIILGAITIFSLMLIYREFNKGRNQTETKKTIGKIIYETFNAPIESMTTKNPRTNCPKLSRKNPGKDFCKKYDNDKVSEDCLTKRCTEIGNSAKFAPCCKENITNMDYNYYKN